MQRVLPAKPSAVLWDIDGTLIDSEPLHRATLAALCEAHALGLSDAELASFTGVHVVDVWARIGHRFPDHLGYAGWIAALQAAYAERSVSLRAMQGAVAAVRALHAAGITQACVSNAGRFFVDTNLRALGITDCLAFTLSFEDVPEGKPAPVPYLLACERLGCAPGNAVAVEDSRTGLRAATAAGLFTFAYAPHAPDPEIAALADAIISDLATLPTRIGVAPASHS